MVVRRAFFYWQFAAVVALPAWLLLGWAIWGSAGDFAGIAIATPFLVLALLGVAGVTFARKSVRSTRAVSWIDVAAAGLWHVFVIATGFFGPGTAAFAALSVATGILAFWAAAWQLVDETRRRVKKVFETIERAAVPYQPRRTPIDAGEYIVVKPSDPAVRPSDPPR
ncbi:hypothetical protein [Naasia sp. SYSU D00948]|uniref:hypothetical protein n=1 Tax=Naasia sp. SYSU D00948 TaxID=2817379 RepID=UPI001B314863|nr:hypothetical protein [Naasia sp. SYSU D00948]